jgi:hypothetical protein
MREVDPVDTILQMAGGHVVPRCLHVTADLGVADAPGGVSILEATPA